MGYIEKLRVLLFFTFLVPLLTIGQLCDQEKTITICDFELIDFDNNGTPDGIIDLYAESGTQMSDGIWSVALNNAIVLDPENGHVSIWDLRNSSTAVDDYVFTLSSPNCESGVVMKLNLILGPYSGVALLPDAEDINYYLCSSEGLDLDTLLVDNASVPIAHINGTWSLSANNPTGGFLNDLGEFRAFVEYQPGLPRVDRKVFELVYTVAGILPCKLKAETIVKVAVVRQVSAGKPQEVKICESAIVRGDYDKDIDIRDDQYLVDEDIEGYWFDDLHGNSDNLHINIKDLYEELIDNGNNLRFGCKEYNYKYKVEKRSVVCKDSVSEVTFTIYEQLRSFQQGAFPELCPEKVGDPPVKVKLFDFLKFEDGFVYKDDVLTNWEFVSGPSNLGLVTKLQEDPDNPEDLTCREDPRITNNIPEPFYNSDGLVSINGAESGEYRFRYSVCPAITGCESESGCPSFLAEVVLKILKDDYAGEDTKELSFCESTASLDLRSLLRTNGEDTIVETGVWTDENGGVVNNDFEIPMIDEEKDFFFTYTTTSIDGCENDATLSFTVFKEVSAGQDGINVKLCSDDLSIILFDHLEGDPDPTGIWKGPFAYISPDHLGVFSAQDNTLPILGPGEYTYTVKGNEGCTDSAQAKITISIVDPIEIGNDVNETYCKLDGQVNLYSLLDRDTVRTGFFVDEDNTNALSTEGVLAFETLTNGIYNFKYVVQNELPCDESSLYVNIQIIDIPIPTITTSEFCILDAKRLEDIEVIEGSLNHNWYETLESDIPIITNPLLFDNQTYYLASYDANNCESERLKVSVIILNTGERSSEGELCTLDFQDGVSPNGDNQNDTLDLFIEGVYNLPVAFPDFELKIFNRYGSLVYEGNRNTEEFRGESNVSLRLGDDLPSGTYFYIFTPNFDSNLPIQASFYLSR